MAWLAASECPSACQRKGPQASNPTPNPVTTGLGPPPGKAVQAAALALSRGGAAAPLLPRRLGGLFKKSGTGYSGSRSTTSPMPPLSVGSGLAAQDSATPYQAPLPSLQPP